MGRATLLDGRGKAQGEARLVKTRRGVDLRITAKGLAAGPHGAHLHTTGSCTAPDFASAGPHLNPTARMHGSRNPHGPHLGDLPNLVASRGGRATLSMPLSGSAEELATRLFDADGTAVVVHAGPDDYVTDPSGNSGGRVLCGVLTRG
jgi:Cu-Zn family superoxide dismutase